MKGPHAAALAAGWLAVALSMAALATAAISRVGTQSSGAQAQVTITMTATVRTTSAPAAPSSPAQIPRAAATTAASTIDPPPTTQVGRSSTVSRTIVPPVAIAPAPAASTSRPVVAVPDIGMLLPSTKTPTPTATTKKPTKTPTPSATTKNTVEASGSLDSWWKHHQGRIHAGCRGDKLVYAEAWAASGYRVTKSTTWIRTAIRFDGSSPVTVLVGCHHGHASFSTSG